MQLQKKKGKSNSLNLFAVLFVEELETKRMGRRWQAKNVGTMALENSSGKLGKVLGSLMTVVCDDAVVMAEGGVEASSRWWWCQSSATR